MTFFCPYNTHTAQEPGSLFWCHAVISLLTVHYICYIACRGRLRDTGADNSKIGFYCVAVPWQQRFTSSYGSTRFAACDWWTQTSVAVNATRQWLLIAVSHAVSYCVKRNIAANEAHFLDCCRNMGHFLCGVKRLKRYVNAHLHLHCIVSNLKTKSKMSTCPPLQKFLRTLMPVFII